MKSPGLAAFLIVVVSALTAGLFASKSFARGADVAKAALDTLRQLDGTWVGDAPGPDGKDQQIVFHVTSNGSTVMETMFPGAKHEMVNAYHMDGDRLIVTHYCAMGVQPRMKLVSNENGVLKFEF